MDLGDQILGIHSIVLELGNDGPDVLTIVGNDSTCASRKGRQ